MAVRNFWIELNVDGRESTVATGPRSKDGGFSLTIKQRAEGGIVDALKVWGLVHSDGKLELRVEENPGTALSVASTVFESRR